MLEAEMNTAVTDFKKSQGEASGASGEHPLGDLGQIIGLGVFMALWIVDSFVLRISTGLADVVPPAVRLSAAGLVFLSAVYFIRAGHRAVEGDEPQPRKLIREGAFGRVRHPLYAGSLMFYLSFVLATLSLLSMAVWGALFVFYDAIASYEERGLCRAFGPQYREYRGKVSKWLPRPKAARFD